MKPYWIYTGLVSTILVGKCITSGSPYIFKNVVNNTTTNQRKENQKKDISVLSGLVLFFSLRVVGSYLNETRNVLVNKLSYQRTNLFCESLLTNKLTNLNTQLNKSDWSVPIYLKKFERARKGYKTLYTIKYTHIIPTTIEFGLSSALIVQQLGFSFCGVLLSTVALYMYRSIQIANSRTKERQEFNQLENQLHHHLNQYLTKSVSFNLESITNLSLQEEKMIKSLKQLNVEQQIILALGSIGLTYLWYIDPTLEISDFVMMHLLSLQLFQPLNQVGMIYREYVQSKQDIKELEAKE
jgi:ATP-binding cassette, subfamily B, heavy metal transporter